MGEERMDGHDGNAEAPQTDRRDALKKIGVGAAVAWAAPTVLSLNSPAAAASSPCTVCGAELLTPGQNPPTPNAWNIPIGTFVPPNTYDTDPATGNFLTMNQLVTPAALNCDFKNATLSFTLAGASASFSWSAEIRRNTSGGAVIASGGQGGGTGTNGLKSISGVIPAGTTALFVRIIVDTSDVTESVVNPSLRIGPC